MMRRVLECEGGRDLYQRCRREELQSWFGLGIIRLQRPHNAPPEQVGLGVAGASARAAQPPTKYGVQWGAISIWTAKCTGIPANPNMVSEFYLMPCVLAVGLDGDSTFG